MNLNSEITLTSYEIDSAEPLDEMQAMIYFDPDDPDEN